MIKSILKTNLNFVKTNISKFSKENDMLFEEISPFVRYASHIKCSVPDLEVCACDTHFYYFLCEIRLWINGEAHTVKRGSVAIIPPATPYKFIGVGALEVLSINFDYTTSCAHLIESISPLQTKNFNINAVTQRSVFDDATFFNLPIVLTSPLSEGAALRIIEEFSAKRIFSKKVCSSLLAMVLTDIARACTVGEVGNEKIGKALEYIRLHIFENISNDDIANAVGYHPYHLNRLMKKYTGKTIRQYIINLRLDNAKNMLMTTDCSVSQISLACGYGNLSNFSLDFKRKFGFPPSEFRKHYNNAF